ncbi:heterodisulfide reductase-related iron-sulfur binding cluster [Corynebacterium occultum]|nr:heterodisulfide reductase-related iron-sulfur binding cluster [Corynebacterium occultum]
MSTATIVLGFIGILLSLPAWVLFIKAVSTLFRFITAGQPTTVPRFDQPIKRLWTMSKEIFGHTTMLKRPWVGVAHWFVMVGFLFGSIVWFEAYIQAFDPAGGWPFLNSWPVYHFVEEVLALGTIIGILFLIGVRMKLGHSERSSRFYYSQKQAAWAIEAIVLLEGLGMLLVKAGKIATFGGGHPVADFLSIHIAELLPASPVMVSVFAVFKLLGGMAFLILVARSLTWGVAWHRFLAFFNIYFRRFPTGEQALGKMKPMESRGKALTMDNVEDDDVLGVGTLQDASWKMLLDVSTCTECGRCQDQCPAWATEKPLSPKKFVMDIREAAVANASYLMDPSSLDQDNSHAGMDVLKLAGEGGVISDDVLWSCTSCGACVEQCPVDIEHIDHISDLRRFQVLADSEFPSELTGLFKNLEAKGNPWGQNNKQRATWVEEARRDGLEVPVFGEDIQDFQDTEYLFWVGCAGAFDDDGRKTTRAVVELLHTAGVKFAVLSKGETCTGDPARRAGNEFLFQMLAAENIETLNGVFEGVPEGQRKIITTCPHCFNTLRNEYPDFDGHYDVFHHTQLLNRLVREKLLTPVPRTEENRKPITYHDPCFLGRHNKVFDPPRELLNVTGMEVREMDRNRNEGFCCGAGGARMFMEENIGTRINENRTAEALSTGAEEIAVGCPFCNVMIGNGVKALSDAPKAEQPKVRDVSRMLRDSVLVDGTLPAPREKQFLESPTREALNLGITPKKKDKALNDAPKTNPAPTAGSTPVAPPAGGALGAPAAPGAMTPPAPGSTPVAPGGVPTPPAAPGGAPAAPSAPGAPGTPGAMAPAAPGSAPIAPGGAPLAPGSAPIAPGATTPAAPGGTPAAPGSAPAAPSSAPAAPGGTPTAPGGTPAGPGSAPLAPGSAPAAPGAASPATPAAPGGAPGGTPMAPGSAPAAPGGTPTVPSAATPTPLAAPTAPGGAPAVPGSAPAAPGAATPAVPAAPGSAPTAPGGVPTAPGRAPAAPGSAPAAPGGAPAAPGAATPAPPAASSGAPTAPGGAPAAPGSTPVPPGAAVPAPGSAPAAPGGAAPQPPTPGSTPVAPGASAPAPPGGAPVPPGGAPAAPGSATPPVAKPTESAEEQSDS